MSVRLTPAQAKSVAKYAKDKGAVVVSYDGAGRDVRAYVESSGEAAVIGARGATKEVS